MRSYYVQVNYQWGAESQTVQAASKHGALAAMAADAPLSPGAVSYRVWSSFDAAIDGESDILSGVVFDYATSQ